MSKTTQTEHLNSSITEAERLTEEILNVILSLATLDFTKTVRVGYEDSNFNAVAAGLNMLGQELQRSVVSKQYVDNILSSMSDALFVINPNNTLRTVNSYAATLLGYSQSDLVDQPSDIIFETSIDWLDAKKSSLFQGGVLGRADIVFKTKDGKKIPMQIKGSLMTGADGETTGVVLVARDMRETLRLIKAAEDAAEAERKKSQELEEAHKKLEGANNDLKVANHSLEREVQNRKIAEANLQEAHDDLERQVQARTQELSDTNKRLNLEVEERKRAEEEVRAREEKYRNIFETTPISMWEQDFSPMMARIEQLKSEGVSDFSQYSANHPNFVNEALGLVRIIDANESAVRTFEAIDKESLISNYRSLLVDETFKTFEKLIISLSQGNEAFDSETVVKTIRGKRINIIKQLRLPAKGSKHINASVSMVDVTSQRELEQQLRQSQKMEAIGRLAGGVAHDFNNLLTVILNYGQMLVDDNNIAEGSKHKVDAIVECAERAASLTQQLLAFSRRQMIEPKVLDLNAVLGKMEKMLQRLLGEDIELINHMNPNAGKVKADLGQIEQIVMNIAVNSRDAMPKGGRLIVETKNVDLDQAYPVQHPGVEPGHYVMFAISDSGEGMTEEVRLRIFEPFFTTKGVGKGTGLGLSTVYGNVKQNGGHIWVYSEIGHGTTIKVYLPRLEDESVKNTSDHNEQGVIVGGKETILVVEDEDSVRGVACALLKQYGYNILEARNAGEAILISEQTKTDIDLMLTDVIMPNMNGRLLADRLAPIRPTMKVVFMSGYTDNAITHNGILDENTAFLQKPFIPKTLLGKIRDVLDGTVR